MNTKLAQEALAAAIGVLNASGATISGVILLVELDGTGVTVAAELEHPGELPDILEIASDRTRGMMQ